MFCGYKVSTEKTTNGIIGKSIEATGVTMYDEVTNSMKANTMMPIPKNGTSRRHRIVKYLSVRTRYMPINAITVPDATRITASK